MAAKASSLTLQIIEQMRVVATQTRENARVPHSGFKVGAAVLCENGDIIGGCNFELSNMQQTICAEGCAFARANAMGHKKFKAILVIADTENLITPCGRCRQMLVDISYQLQIISATTRRSETRDQTAFELLPYLFEGTKTIKQTPPQPLPLSSSSSSSSSSTTSSSSLGLLKPTSKI